MCYKYGHYNANQMKMEHLSSELFRWLQAGRRRNFCLLPAEKAKQLRLDAPRRLWNPSAPAPRLPQQAPPLHPGRDVRRQKSERRDYRLFCETLAYVTKTVCQETQRDTITNLTAEPVRLRCSHRDLNVSIHDGFVYVRPSQ